MSASDTDTLTAELVKLRAQVAHYEALHSSNPVVTVTAQDNDFHVAMCWDQSWGVGEFAVLLAVIIKNVAHNAGIQIDDLLPAVDEALDMVDEPAGGRLQS